MNIQEIKDYLEEEQYTVRRILTNSIIVDFENAHITITERKRCIDIELYKDFDLIEVAEAHTLFDITDQIWLWRNELE